MIFFFFFNPTTEELYLRVQNPSMSKTRELQKNKIYRLQHFFFFFEDATQLNSLDDSRIDVFEIKHIDTTENK